MIDLDILQLVIKPIILSELHFILLVTFKFKNKLHLFSSDNIGLDNHSMEIWVQEVHRIIGINHITIQHKE